MNLQTSLLIPFLSIWVKPRSTIRKILDSNPEQHVLLLATLSGIYRLIDRASERSFGDSISFIPLLLLCIVGGGVSGVISIYLGGIFFRWIGSWFGGQASSQEVRAALAWSSVPDLVLLAIYLPIIIIFGHNWFISSTEWMNPILAVIVLAVLGPIGFLLLLWRVFLFVKCLAEAHKFSAWKGLGTAILGAIVIVVPFFIIFIALRL